MAYHLSCAPGQGVVQHRAINLTDLGLSPRIWRSVRKWFAQVLSSPSCSSVNKVSWSWVTLAVVLPPLCERKVARIGGIGPHAPIYCALVTPTGLKWVCIIFQLLSANNSSILMYRRVNIISHIDC